MIGLENKTLRSKRLTYRLLEPADKQALRQIVSDESVAEPAGFLAPDTQEKFDGFFAALTRHNTAIAILDGETLTGYIHVYPYTDELPDRPGKRGVSTGFVIGKKYWNRGYATETLQTVTAYLLRTFDFCIADHFVGNEASRKVIEKCGYRYFETYTMPFEALGREMTCHSYIRE